MINSEAWKTMDEQASVALTPVLGSIAQAGNVESITSAFEAGLATSQHDLVSIDRLDAILRVVDGDLEVNTRALAEIAATRWLNSVSQKVRDETLYKVASSTDVRPNSCRLLVLAGANPYKTQDKTKNCALTEVFRRTEDRVLTMLKGILGTEPITDPGQFPPDIPYENNDRKLEHWNILEYAAMLGHFQATDWLKSRIDPESPAKRLLLDLGDGALGRMFLKKDGEPEEKIPAISIENNYLPDALGMLIAGAEFSDPSMWRKVAARPISTPPNDPFIFHIVKNPRHVGWQQVPGHVERLVDTMLKHKAFDVDMFCSAGSTLLMDACQLNQTGLIKVLLEHGADPSLCKQTTNPRLAKVNAISLAKLHCSPDVVQMLEAANAKQAVSQVLAKARKTIPGAMP